MALRMPLFVVEIAAAGEKGQEGFAYTQRLEAVKESALALIDKAIGSTQVRVGEALFGHRNGRAELKHHSRWRLVTLHFFNHSPLYAMINDQERRQLPRA